ncbi:hypothetical protein C8R43DRAFT_482563 [Mycena crocata]|nr:hypothetical protein C8R43DRAFT_482563 [Mycena crocata]
MSSAFADKLGTNYCPVDTEIAEINSLLLEPSRRLDSLNQKIALLQVAMNKLKCERDSLETYLDAHRALISPVRRLPLDIIQEIFAACLPTHRNCVMSATEAPVLLGRICSAWRDISLATPSLWSSLHVAEPVSRLYPHDTRVVDDPAEKKRTQRLEITKMWLGRSGHCPLSISLHCNGPDMMHSVLPFASRWERVEFTVPPEVLALVSHLSEASVPLLKSFATQHWDSAPNEHAWGSWGLLRNPLLSGFSFHGTGALKPLDLPLRWNQLKKLCLNVADGWNVQGPGFVLTSDTALDVLSRCPSLQTCQLGVQNEDTPEPVSTAVFEHPSLRTFDLTCDGSPSVVFQRLLHRLSLPVLRHFVLRAYGSGTQTICHVALPAAAPLLESVDINIEALKMSPAPAFFRSLPSTIREIRITDAYDSRPAPNEEILALLTPSPSPCYCPALEDFHIPNCVSFSDAQLLRFVEARVSAGLPLKHVAISFARGVELDIKPALQPFLENNGLRVELAYPPPRPLPGCSPWQGLPDRPSDQGPYQWPGW